MKPRLGLRLLLLWLLLPAVAGPSCAGKKSRPPNPAEGVASWYGKEFAGRPTASGERFDPHDLTAAHPSLPFGTRVKVTNLENGRSVVVRINDRGPFTKGRMIDLSFAAAKKIGLVESGTARVRLEVLE